MEGAGSCCFLVGENVGEAVAGGIIDTGMIIFPTNPTPIGLDLAVPPDAVAYFAKVHQRFCVQKDQRASMFAHVVSHWLGLFGVRKSGQADLAECPSYGG